MAGANGWGMARAGEMMHHGEREGAKEVYILPGRGGALASHGVRRRRRHDNGKGWTVGEIPTWGGRYLKYRPPPGSLSAVGSGTCGPDRALCCTGSDSDVLVSCQAGAGAACRLAGGRTPRRRCLDSVASVRRPADGVGDLAASSFKTSSSDQLARTGRP